MPYQREDKSSSSAEERLRCNPIVMYKYFSTAKVTGIVGVYLFVSSVQNIPVPDYMGIKVRTE